MNIEIYALIVYNVDCVTIRLGDNKVLSKYIDGYTLRGMIIAGANELYKNRQILDDINVFPFPDGDTGTNMSSTILAAVNELEKTNSMKINTVAKVASGSCLRGARGNSGVILSQLFRGFANGLENLEQATAAELAKALVNASETAYRAVIEPKEGTILTIAHVIGEKATEYAQDVDEIESIFYKLIKRADEVLRQTKYMLTELRQADVIDAGGMGLLHILNGAYEYLTGHSIDFSHDLNALETTSTPAPVVLFNNETNYRYCVEFVFLKETTPETHKAVDELRKILPEIGGSIVLASDACIVKIHVHTNFPDVVLERANSIGQLSDIKIENMQIQQFANKD